MQSITSGFIRASFMVSFILITGCGGGSTNTNGGASGAPTAPTNLTITPGDQKLTLVWSSTDVGAMYHIYCDRDASKANSLREKRGETANKSYDVTGLTNGQTYYCAVTSVKNSVESAAVSKFAVAGMTMNMPMPPTTITVIPGDKQITATWEAVTGATAYRVYYSTATGVNKSTGTKVDTSSPSATINNLVNDTPYYLVVTTFIGTDESVESAQKTATPSATATTIPVAPQSLTATANGLEINLSWNASAGASSYIVYWGTTSTFTPSAAQSATVTTASYTHKEVSTGTPLTANTAYYYQVKAKNNLGESAAASVSATTTTATDTLAAPTNPTASFSGVTLTISWTAASGATGYNVYYAKQTGVTTATTTKKAGITGTSTSIDLTSLNLVNNDTVYYVVTAYKTTGSINRESAPTAEKSIAYTTGTTTPPTSGDAKRGALLYDNWWKAKGVTPPVNQHPLWNTRAFNTATSSYYNQTIGANTWRCIVCHGSDYKGRDGFYGLNQQPTKYTNFPGLTAASAKPAADIVAFLKQGGTTTNHGFISPAYLNDADYADIAAFLTTIVAGNTDTTLTGNTLAGEKLFYVESKNEAGTAIPTCGNLSCHHGQYKELVVTQLAADDPYAFIHRVRFGAAGSSMTEQMSVAQTKDAYAYAKDILRSNFDATRYIADTTKYLSDFNRGKATYKNWVSGNAAESTLTSKHALWPTINTSSTITAATTWRCESCHGSDLLGVNGQFKLGHEYYTNIRGVVMPWPESTTALEKYQFANTTDVFDFVRSSLPSRTNLGPAHAFGHYLTGDDIYGLTRYIQLMRGTTTASNLRSISLGARLYDNFWAQKNIAPATTLQKNPTWVANNTFPATTPAGDTWRCSTCHGWDYVGEQSTVQPTITRGITYTTQAFNQYVSRNALTELIRDSKKQVTASDGSITTITITGHDFGQFLQPHEIEALVDFILDVRASQTNGALITQRANDTTLTADATHYNTGKGFCQACHGVDGKANQTNIVLAAKNNKYMFLHRSRFGAPGSAMMPAADGFQGLTDIEAVKLLHFVEAKTP